MAHRYRSWMYFDALMDYQINKDRNTNQNANKRDKCGIYGYRHGGGCMIKKGVIFKDW
jgi:hypothetical protein